MTDEAITVLLVEDNPGDVDLVRERLAEAGPVQFRVTHVDYLGLGEQLVDRERFDLLLLDLSLPDAQGLEGVRRLRARCGNLPLVVLTGLPDEALALAALREGAQDYLVKGHLESSLLVRTLRYAMERQHTQERLRKTEEQLRQAQKIEAVARLAGGVAHDINNMMTVVIGYSDLLLQCATQWQDIVENIKKAGERSATMTRQLLAFSRKQMLQPVVLDLNALVAGMEERLRARARGEVQLNLALDSTLDQVKVDPGQIEHVILSLVDNACEAMPHGGQLTIETGNVVLDDGFWSDDTERRPGPYTLLAVRDTGCGMDDTTRAHLFEPFFTTKGIGPSTGLGLASVYGIVKQSGGQIAVASTLGQGTTMMVYFPHVEEPTSGSVNPPAYCQENTPALQPT